MNNLKTLYYYFDREFFIKGGTNEIRTFASWNQCWR